MMESKVGKEYVVSDIFELAKGLFRYLLSKWHLILLVVIISGVIGVVFAWFQKPKYTAELTFAPETDKSTMGMYAGIASQFGLDLGGGSGGIFEGETLIQFLKSRMLIEKALFTSVNVNGTPELLINYYVQAHKLDEIWKSNAALKNIVFTNSSMPPMRARDSVLNRIVDGLYTDINVAKISKTANMISVNLTDIDELFPKLMVENLVQNGIKYYTDYRSKKSRENVMILQRQTDSVRELLTSNIVSVAQSTDLNINPIRQVVRTGAQRKQIDVQVNGQVYGELLKQLELSKISLRKETPFVQIIDVPRLPLEKKKMGRLLGGIIFAFVGGMMSMGYFVIKKFADSQKSPVS